MQTDPTADFLTKVRNALRAGKKEVSCPSSKLIVLITGVLKKNGFIHDFDIQEKTPRSSLNIKLKYTKEGAPVLRGIKRISRPGRRVYAGVGQLKPVLNGMGISILTTSKGVMADDECMVQGVGGEIICEVW